MLLSTAPFFTGITLNFLSTTRINTQMVPASMSPESPTEKPNQEDEGKGFFQIQPWLLNTVSHTAKQTEPSRARNSLWLEPRRLQAILRKRVHSPESQTWVVTGAYGGPRSVSTKSSSISCLCLSDVWAENPSNFYWQGNLPPTLPPFLLRTTTPLFKQSQTRIYFCAFFQNKTDSAPRLWLLMPNRVT